MSGGFRQGPARREGDHPACTDRAVAFGEGGEGRPGKPGATRYRVQSLTGGGRRPRNERKVARPGRAAHRAADAAIKMREIL